MFPISRNITRLHSLCLGILIALPLPAATVQVYVLNGAETTISVVDSATNKVVRTIDGIEAPLSVHFSPDGKRGYISGYAENVLNVIDTKTGKIAKKVQLSGRPDDIAVTQNGKLIVVCIQDRPGALDIVDAELLQKIKTIPTKNGDWLHDVVVTRDGNYAIAGAPDGKTATVFDLIAQKIAWEFPFDQGVMPLAIEFNPNGSGNRLFLQLRKLNGFAVIDFAKRTELARITFPEAPNPFTIRDAFSHGMDLSPDGKTIWFASRPNNAVYVYSLDNLKLVGSVPLPEVKLPSHTLGAEPNWLVFTPDGKRAYVSNSATNNVTVIDVKTMKVITNIPVGDAPVKMGVVVIP